MFQLRLPAVKAATVTPTASHKRAVRDWDIYEYTTPVWSMTSSLENSAIIFWCRFPDLNDDEH